jgi:hypothetical protein
MQVFKNVLALLFQLRSESASHSLCQLTIQIQMNSDFDATRAAASHTQRIIFNMAKMLKLPSGGDVEFVFPKADGSVDDSTPRLYAFEHMIKDPSFEYNCSLCSIRLLNLVLDADCPDGMISVPPSPTTETPPSPTTPSRRTIFVHDDFELFHVVLFYLYTHEICFVMDVKTQSDPDIPSTNDAEGIYAIAHRLNVDSLKRKALRFLKSTSTLTNISGRTFSSFAAAHPEAEEWYDAFFMENWDQVKHTPEFEQVFVKLEENPAEFIHMARKFRKMMVNRA